MNHKKKVLIHIYTSGNLGDDLFVRTILDRYRRWDVAFYLLVWNKAQYKYMLGEYENLTLQKAPRPVLAIRIISKLQEKMFHIHDMKEKGYKKAYKALGRKKYDVLVNVGGSSFAEYENDTWPLYLLQDELLVSHVNTRNKILLNINFGPYVTEAFRSRCEALFGRYERVIFRDIKTWNTFPNLRNTEVAPDIVLNMDLSEIVRGIVAEDDMFCVNVIDLWENKRTRKEREPYVANYEKTVQRIVSLLLAAGARISLIGFEARRDEQYIDRIIAEVEPGMKGRIAKLVYSGTNLKEIIQSMARARAVLSTRFHAMILCLILNKVQYPICYDNKQKSFLKDMHYMEPYSVLADIAKPEKIVHYLRTAVLDGENYKNIIAQSGKHFEYLDLLLQE